MNARIRELSEQADGVFIHKLMTGAKQYTFLEKDLEKFAQLIAQESIVDFYRRYLDICTDEDITVQVERYVKEYFGVEE